MIKEPIANEPDNPLISFFIHKYSGRYLRQCFESILKQDIIDNFEIVYLDDVSTDGAWEIAVEYAKNYASIITISRNKNSGSAYDNYLNLIKGKYFISLTSDDAFLPEYFSKCIQLMEGNPCLNFDKVKNRRREMALHPLHSNTKPVLQNNHLPIHGKPLVSITVHNYNYGRYLRQCLDSIFLQTYENVEVCFSDNASDDDSWSIAQEYALKYAGKMYITRNRSNFGSDANYLNCWKNVGGKYLVTMCSDDVFMPDFVEKSVNALEKHQNAAYVMVHRAIINDEGNRTDEPPFYKHSCLISGAEQAAVYMLAAVNPSISQVMYRISSIYGKSNPGSLGARWYGNRFLDFNICCEYDMVYLKEPLLLHRLHSQNDSSLASENLIEVIAPYILQHQLAETAAIFNLQKVVVRLPQAIEKLSHLCIRYCVRSLVAGNEVVAQRYFHLSIALMPQVADNSTFKVLEEYWRSGSEEKAELRDTLASEDNLATRSVSYEPPPGSIPLGDI